MLLSDFGTADAIRPSTTPPRRHRADRVWSNRLLAMADHITRHDIKEFISDAELELIAADPDAVEYDNLPEEETVRYNEFGDAWIQKMASGGPQPLDRPVAPETEE